MSTTLVLKHTAAAVATALLTYGFWLTRPEWDPEMRFWRAIGDASLMLLYITLAVGPLAKLSSLARRLVRYRREAGIWFAVSALIHTILILNGWARWDAMTFLGYEFVPQLGRLVRLEPGFGLANLMGLAAALIAVPLLVTSADWAVRRLGSSAWKFLHYGSYTIFWLVALHTAYFLFLHFTQHFHRTPPPNLNWFRWPFVGLTLLVAALQTAAFLKTVQRQRRRGVFREDVEESP